MIKTKKIRSDRRTKTNTFIFYFSFRFFWGRGGEGSMIDKESLNKET